MAGAIVSHALVSSFIQVVFDKLASPEFVNFIRGKKLHKKLIKRLETNLYAVQAVLNDAEQRQINDPAVKKWLDDVKDAVYDVDDLLDRVSTEAGTAQKKVVTKLEDITERLEYAGKSKDILGLKENARESLLWRTPSTSLLERSTIYGRDQDKEAIMELLFDDTTYAKISVIPIVGMGGFGKTTLAQLVYNDESLEQIFDLKLWIYVSENFDIQKITKTMIEAVTSSSCDMKDLGFLQLELKEKLIGKKYLVVLDDVWNENYGVWNDFQKPLQHGAKGK
ncbi:putative disease resistance RPP13-like protein 1 [Arachis hypogaea]|uniref:putative disease resistance RPP13-like protein 1 n=1 Tax=Arachis hypogaea TaxID=3818 RepID=UPI0007AEF23B